MLYPSKNEFFLYKQYFDYDSCGNEYGNVCSVLKLYGIIIILILFDLGASIYLIKT